MRMLTVASKQSIGAQSVATMDISAIRKARCGTFAMLARFTDVIYAKENDLIWMPVSKINSAHPTVRVGFAPRGILINTAQSLGNNTRILLFFLPDRALSLVHHLVGTDHVALTQTQETKA